MKVKDSMNNYKGFIDNIVIALEEPMLPYNIEKQVHSSNIVYILNFKFNDESYICSHDKEEIRELTDDLLFGLQGKQSLPQIIINGPCNAFGNRDFMQSLFSNIEHKEHRDYLFNIFFQNLSPSTSLKALVRSRSATDDVKVIEEIVSYMLSREAQSENKSLDKLNDILQSLRQSHHYSYTHYKPQVLELLNAYEPLIIENDKNPIKNFLGDMLNPREEIASYVSLKESPSNYKDYNKYLPLGEILTKPPENLFTESRFQLYNFDLSFINLIQNNDLLINLKAIKEHITLVINSINLYLNDNPVKGLIEIGEMPSFNRQDHKTNLWLKIDKESPNININKTIEFGHILFDKVSSYHRQLVLNDDVNVNIEQALDKSVHNFVLDTILPNKEQQSNKIKVKL